MMNCALIEPGNDKEAWAAGWLSGYVSSVTEEQLPSWFWALCIFHQGQQCAKLAMNRANLRSDNYDIDAADEAVQVAITKSIDGGEVPPREVDEPQKCS
jgi:hypothetical protein